MTLNYSLLLLFSFIVDIRFVNPSCAYDVQEINWIHVFVACIQTPHIYNRGIRENRTVGDVASFWSGLKSGVHAFEVALKVEASFQNWQVQKKRKKKGNLASKSAFEPFNLLFYYAFSASILQIQLLSNFFKKELGGGGHNIVRSPHFLQNVPRA